MRLDDFNVSSIKTANYENCLIFTLRDVKICFLKNFFAAWDNIISILNELKYVKRISIPLNFKMKHRACKLTFMVIKLYLALKAFFK